MVSSQQLSTSTGSIGRAETIASTDSPMQLRSLANDVKYKRELNFSTSAGDQVEISYKRTLSDGSQASGSIPKGNCTFDGLCKLEMSKQGSQVLYKIKLDQKFEGELTIKINGELHVIRSSDPINVEPLKRAQAEERKAPIADLKMPETARIVEFKFSDELSKYYNKGCTLTVPAGQKCEILFDGFVGATKVNHCLSPNNKQDDIHCANIGRLTRKAGSENEYHFGSYNGFTGNVTIKIGETSRTFRVGTTEEQKFAQPVSPSSSTSNLTVSNQAKEGTGDAVTSNAARGLVNQTASQSKSTEYSRVLKSYEGVELKGMLDSLAQNLGIGSNRKASFGSLLYVASDRHYSDLGQVRRAAAILPQIVNELSDEHKAALRQCKICIGSEANGGKLNDNISAGLFASIGCGSPNLSEAELHSQIKRNLVSALDAVVRRSETEKELTKLSQELGVLKISLPYERAGTAISPVNTPQAVADKVKEAISLLGPNQRAFLSNVNVVVGEYSVARYTDRALGIRKREKLLLVPFNKDPARISASIANELSGQLGISG